jgi:signal transduction histidine kinase
MRRRLSWLVVITTSTVIVSFVIPLCLLVRTLAEDRSMAAADQEARSVAILVAGLSDNPRQLREFMAGIDQRGATTTRVLTADGRELGSGPPMKGDPDVRRALSGNEAFTVVDSSGGRVLLPVVVESGTAVVRSTVGPADLRRGVARAWAGIIGLGAALLVLALVLASRLGRRISEPLLDVAGTAHRLREGDLAARAEVRGTEETRELARALNGLAERTGELLVSERAAVGDLSHRLRTPVTALRLDAEAVPDPELAQRLQEHIAVLQRTVDAIVKEARRPVRTDLAPACDATAAVGSRVDFWRPLADDQDRELRVQLPEGPLPVPLAVEDLTDLVDVLIDNVFAHTPEGTGLRLDLHEVADTSGGRSVVLLVADAGTGFSPGGRRQRRGSTGLGLDIARRIVAGCGGRLRLGTAPEGGALVEVVLPRGAG